MSFFQSNLKIRRKSDKEHKVKRQKTIKLLNLYTSLTLNDL